MTSPRAYVSPFPDPEAAEKGSREDRMLARVEPRTRELLVGAEVTRRVARWVAGGRSPEGRERRAEVALYVRARLGCEGWPELWQLGFFADRDAAACKARRDRGLPRRAVEEHCADVKDEDVPKKPPRKRPTKRERQAVTVAEQLARIEALAASVRAGLAAPNPTHAEIQPEAGPA